MEEEATKAAAINCQPCNPSCNTPSFTGCAFVDALHMVLSKSNSPRNMTKTKHALQWQRGDPPLTSLPSLSTGMRMLLLENSIVFPHVSPSPAWMSVALAGVRIECSQMSPLVTVCWGLGWSKLGLCCQ